MHSLFQKASGLTETIGDGWPQFEKLVQSYSFPGAQARLEVAMKKLRTA